MSNKSNTQNKIVGFEWRTEEDSGWGADLPGEAAEAKTTRYGLGIWLAAVFMLGVAGLLLYGRLNQHVTETALALNQEVLAAHRLVQQAAVTGDDELFLSLHSRHNREWYTTQQSLLRADLFLHRSPLGFWLLSPIELPDGEAQVFLSPDLTEAEVREVWPHLIEPGEMETLRIKMERTAVYRRDPATQSWLLSPPQDGDAFWGTWLTEKGQFLSLIFPERDESYGRRLASDLEKLIQQVCLGPKVTCPADLHLHLRLERGAGSLLSLDRPYQQINLSSTTSAVGRLHHLNLPAPTIVGRPIDEAGYHALYQGYAAWVAVALINSFNEPSTAPQTMSQSLAQLGLRPPSPPSYHPIEAWLPPPIALPDQDIQLLCVSFPPPQMLRYNPHTNQWLDEWPQGGEAGLHFMREANSGLIPLPGGEGVLIHGVQAVEGLMRWRTYLWADGASRLLIDSDQPVSAVPAFSSRIHPNGRYLLIQPTFNVEHHLLNWRLLDLEDCLAGRCDLQDFAARPYWSPDGNHTLLEASAIRGAAPELFLGDKDGRIIKSIGPGLSPFWLDGETYGYLRPVNSSLENGPLTTEIVTAVIPNDPTTIDTFELLIPATTLTSALTANQRPDFHQGEELVMHDVLVSPTQPDWLFISAFTFQRNNNGVGAHYLFSFHRPTGQAELLPQTNWAWGLSPFLSQNGRSLILPAADMLYIHDIEKNQTRTFRGNVLSYDWAANDEWLVVAEHGLIRLIAPAHGYERPIFHNLNGCTSAVWVNKP